MNYLVQKLRCESHDENGYGHPLTKVLMAAADRIEALETTQGADKAPLIRQLQDAWVVATERIEALEAALREIACKYGTHDRGRADCCIARRALEGKP